MSDLWIPITGAICLTIMVIVNAIASGKNKKEIQLTIRQLLDKGESITPELLEKLGTFKSQKIIDLRRALALASVGLACVLSGFIVNEIRIGLAIGIFPLLLGVAFFLCWKTNQNAE
ncbi:MULTISPECIES: DUF6249 domain-containing protein [unclassified Pseudoalteromonas]|uniref:DUF6249 domain-containing protein n=1 Tax=unclassified Pseudoalteromonas TaxID=194690 RepID=UPI000731EFAE|nr:DUF6249 domain-containing protein [Pseudoalteromonas sp. 10-33]KTF10174.1 hypothetical protein ATS76_09350 [Pseudoalteromonas sp. 10-33]